MVHVLQVSPLFGTIYSSVFFMAHAVHRVWQSREGMSGGSLAQHTWNLAFQVLRGYCCRALATQSKPMAPEQLC